MRRDGLPDFSNCEVLDPLLRKGEAGVIPEGKYPPHGPPPSCTWAPADGKLLGCALAFPFSPPLIVRRTGRYGKAGWGGGSTPPITTALAQRKFLRHRRHRRKTLTQKPAPPEIWEVLMGGPTRPRSTGMGVGLSAPLTHHPYREIPYSPGGGEYG